MAKPVPTGQCWCGCGQSVGEGAFFSPGHDRRAEAAVLDLEYGGRVAALLAAHGYGPDGKNATDELRKYRQRDG